jgi:hypothetical protein
MSITNLRTVANTIPLVSVGLVLATISSSHATVFTGIDRNASSDAGLVNSKAAQLAFDASASTFGTVKTNGFESYPQANVFTTGIVNSDFVVTFAGSGESAYVVSAPLSTQNPPLYFPHDSLNGFDTDPGPATSHFVFVEPAGTPGKPGFATITFVKPVNAFGIYITGFGNISPNKMLQISLDGSNFFNISGSPIFNKAGAEFFGVTGVGPFTTVTFKETGDKSGSDKFGLDSLSYVFAVPEPSTVAMFTVGGLALLTLTLKKRNRHTLLV